MSELPTYPADAAEREETAMPLETTRGYSSWGRRAAAYLLDTLVLAVPLIIVILVAVTAADPEN